MKRKFNKFVFLLLPTTMLTSCGSGSSWQIKYGDIVNCLDNQTTEGKSTYQNLQTIKNAIKLKANKAIDKQIKQDLLPKWTNDSNRSEIYFDIIASLAFNFKVNDSINYDLFYVCLNSQKNEVTIKTDKNIDITSSDIQYNFNETNKEINICLLTNQLIIKSYTYESINQIIKE